MAVRRKVVDARYLEASIPATHTVPFRGGARRSARPINDLPAAAQSAYSYAVLGSGKTAADACIWLLDNGVEPDRIRWVRPREAWFYDRSHFQPLEQVGAIMEGIALDAEAGAEATDVDDLFERLEASGRLMRIDPSWPATMYRGTMLSAVELQPCGRLKTSSGSAERSGSRSTDRARARGDQDRPGGPACGLHGARPEQRPRHADLSARSDRASAGAPPLSAVSTQPSSALSRPTGMTTRTRTGSVPPIHTPAVSRTGHA